LNGRLSYLFVMIIVILAHERPHMRKSVHPVNHQSP
jgi:hypothetical protein